MPLFGKNSHFKLNMKCVSFAPQKITVIVIIFNTNIYFGASLLCLSSLASLHFVFTYSQSSLLNSE